MDRLSKRLRPASARLHNHITILIPIPIPTPIPIILTILDLLKAMFFPSPTTESRSFIITALSLCRMDIQLHHRNMCSRVTLIRWHTSKAIPSFRHNF